MLDTPPKEPEWLSWLYVFLGSLIIFCTVPFARALQSGITDHLGGNFFLYFVAAAVAAGGLIAFRNLRIRRPQRSAYLWLLGVGIAFAAYAYNLRGNPVETVHFVEYGLLALLVYRALVHRIRDHSIFVTAILIIGSVGIIDEWLQWIAPSRYWDLRDVRINLIAGALTQLAIVGGLRPRLVSGWPSGANLRRLFFSAAFFLFLLGLSYANTPERIPAYATRIPFLSFLMTSKSMMVEYGYLYRDPNIGVFRSRFTLEELETNDRERGLKLAEVFDTYFNEQFGPFQEVYSVPRDAYIHEAGIHLFRRNRYLEVARSEEIRRRLHYNIALRENQILEKYFPTGLKNSSHLWTDELQKQIDEKADKEPLYESRVSAGLITRVSERQALSGFGLGITAMLLLAVFFGERRNIRSPPSMSNKGA